MLLARPALASDWRPSQPLRVLVAAAPGGTLDIHARAAQGPLTARLGQSVIVENQGGGAGRVAALQMGRAAPDGHAMLVASGDGLVLQDILAGARHGKARPNLRAVTMTVSAAQLLITHPRSGITDVQGYFAALRTRGDRVTLAVPGADTVPYWDEARYAAAQPLPNEKEQARIVEAVGAHQGKKSEWYKRD